MKSDNSIDYVEFASTDLDATKTFFSKLLDWKFEDYGPDYTAFTDDNMNGGFFKSSSVATVSQGAPLVVLYHSNLEGIKTLVTELGGTIKLDIFSFPGGKRFQFIEPGGNELAFWSE